MSTTAAALEVLFQLAIVATGNYAWINWVGVLPCIALFDDDTLAWIYPTGTVREDGTVLLSSSTLYHYELVILWAEHCDTLAVIDNAFFMTSMIMLKPVAGLLIRLSLLWGCISGHCCDHFNANLLDVTSFTSVVHLAPLHLPVLLTLDSHRTIHVGLLEGCGKFKSILK